jgi:hypothetical protein
MAGPSSRLVGHGYRPPVSAYPIDAAVIAEPATVQASVLFGANTAQMPSAQHPHAGLAPAYKSRTLGKRGLVMNISDLEDSGWSSYCCKPLMSGTLTKSFLMMLECGNHLVSNVYDGG